MHTGTARLSDICTAVIPRGVPYRIGHTTTDAVAALSTSASPPDRWTVRRFNPAARQHRPVASPVFKTAGRPKGRRRVRLPSSSATSTRAVASASARGTAAHRCTELCRWHGPCFSKPRCEPGADLNRLDRMEHLLKRRRSRGRHARFVSIYDVVITTIEQVQEFNGYTPGVGDLVAGERVARINHQVDVRRSYQTSNSPTGCPEKLRPNPCTGRTKRLSTSARASARLVGGDNGPAGALPTIDAPFARAVYTVGLLVSGILSPFPSALR